MYSSNSAAAHANGYPYSSYEPSDSTIVSPLVTVELKKVAAHYPAIEKEGCPFKVVTGLRRRLPELSDSPKAHDGAEDGSQAHQVVHKVSVEPVTRRLKVGTSKLHRAAENVLYVRRFLKGGVSREERDLNELVGVEEAEKLIECPLRPAVRAYCDRLSSIPPTMLLAHCYTRYLGDLSGGQILRKAAKRHLGSDCPTRFYEFEEIGNCQAMKDRYKSAIDSCGIAADVADALVEESLCAYALNVQLFEEMDFINGYASRVQNSTRDHGLSSVWHLRAEASPSALKNIVSSSSAVGGMMPRDAGPSLVIPTTTAAARSPQAEVLDVVSAVREKEEAGQGVSTHDTRPVDDEDVEKPQTGPLHGLKAPISVVVMADEKTYSCKGPDTVEAEAEACKAQSALDLAMSYAMSTQLSSDSAAQLVAWRAEKDRLHEEKAEAERARAEKERFQSEAKARAKLLAVDFDEMLESHAAGQQAEGDSVALHWRKMIDVEAGASSSPLTPQGDDAKASSGPDSVVRTHTEATEPPYRSLSSELVERCRCGANTRRRLDEAGLLCVNCDGYVDSRYPPEAYLEVELSRTIDGPRTLVDKLSHSSVPSASPYRHRFSVLSLNKMTALVVCFDINRIDRLRRGLRDLDLRVAGIFDADGRPMASLPMLPPRRVGSSSGGGDYSSEESEAPPRHREGSRQRSQKGEGLSPAPPPPTTTEPPPPPQAEIMPKITQASQPAPPPPPPAAPVAGMWAMQAGPPPMMAPWGMPQATAVGYPPPAGGGWGAAAVDPQWLQHFQAVYQASGGHFDAQALQQQQQLAMQMMMSTQQQVPPPAGAAAVYGGSAYPFVQQQQQPPSKGGGGSLGQQPRR
ncbi:Heme oxygenase 2 [Perkinsus olseni]|uniref:Heme oxygenase 2 n=3 Tax=Perkinsus olseni TaxID=32597 RepID=A0A7J6NTN7_PEROL|nr:Heme oxygenase 2 [Perkinsus olseni]